MILDYLADFQRHIRVFRGVQESTARIYAAKLRQFNAWLLASNRPTEPARITQKDVEDYLEHLFYIGNSPETGNTKRTAVSQFAHYLMYKGIIQKDPTAEIPRPRIRHGFIQKFSQSEVMRIFSAIDLRTEKDFRDFVIIMVALFAGPRLGEIISLRYQDAMDGDKGELELHFIGKFREHRVVSLWKVPSDILRIWQSIRLAHRARVSDPLFISYCRGGSRIKGQRLTHSAVDTMIKDRAAAAGIRKPRISMHMLRATHASYLRHVHGYDSHAIAERLGHKSTATTDRYTPSRDRIGREYPSLAAYWQEFTNLWRKRQEEGLIRSIIPHGGAPDA